MLEINGWIPAHTLPLPLVHATAACRYFFMLPMSCFACCLQYKKAKKDLCHFLKLFSANAVLIAKYDITVLQIRQKLFLLFCLFFSEERTWKISLQICRQWCLPNHQEMFVVWLSLYKAQYQMDVWMQTGPLMTFIHDILPHGLGYLKTQSQVSCTPWTATHKLLLLVNYSRTSRIKGDTLGTKGRCLLTGGDH